MNFNKANLPILIVIAILVIVTLVKVFQVDTHFKFAKKELEKTEEALNNAQKSNEKAQQEIQLLQKKLTAFKTELELISAERDSLVLEQQRKTAKNWDELQKIKEEQDAVNHKLKELREEGEKFE